MTFLKLSAFTLILLLFSACGGTNGETDYSQITDVELFAMANNEMHKGNYQKAIDDYNRILTDFPISNLHIDCQLKIAEAYGKLDNFEEQMFELHRLVKENIIPERVPKIYVQIGKFYERAALFNPGIITTDTSDYKKAMDYYDKALKYPDSDDNKTKSEAVYRRALVEAKIGQINDAIDRYKLVSSLFPNSDYSVLAQIKLKDPSNTNELVTTDSALTQYRATLGIAAPPPSVEQPKEAKTTETPAEQKTEQATPGVENQEQEGNLNDTFNYQKGTPDSTNNTNNESINSEENAAPQNEGENSETPVLPQSPDSSLTPAEGDSSGF